MAPKKPKTILATGGAGFIGSHVVNALSSSGYNVVIIDNFENSDRSVIDRLQRLSNRKIPVIEADIRDQIMVKRALRRHRVDAVIHLAGKKAVGESVSNPLLYYFANLNGTISLLSAMKECNTQRLVFSSSATVYGATETLPIDESVPTKATNPYGRTKEMSEEIISDFVHAVKGFEAISLRYFNPVGAHESALIGENPRDIPNNLFPYVAQTAVGQREKVQVFGGDYNTPDGSGLRDYIHVEDLARGHVAAINLLLRDSPRLDHRHMKVNLGTGTAHSVLEVIAAFSQAAGRSVPFEVTKRRPGDVAASVAAAGLARELLGWEAEHDLNRMCKDHLRFQRQELKRSATKPASDLFPAAE